MILTLLGMIVFLFSCQPKNCPAYAKNNTEYGKIG